MHLKSLELCGFKSFAAKANLSFTSSITAIVGPNGSGKSNVAEAFQFVLGEQSIKSLRGRRGEDLIWNGGGSPSGGSTGSGRANRASVKLVFDNSAKIFSNIDFDEVSIERIVNRDNSNEYVVNGSQVRLKDIVELLAMAHIGATGHHIISQGEADRILSASIGERREMIEDALGLKIYQWKKLESVRKLERTDENMKQVESLRREIAPHLKFLKKQVEKVEKVEMMRKELVVLYKEYFGNEEHYIVTEKKRLSDEIVGPQRELSELDRALEKAKNILVASKGRDSKSEKIIKLEDTLAAIRIERDTIMRELGRIEGELNAEKRVMKKEESRIKNEESRVVYLKDVEDIVRTIESMGTIDDAKRLFGEIIDILKGFVARHRKTPGVDSGIETGVDIRRLSEEKDHLESKLKAVIDKESMKNLDYQELKKLIEKEKDTDRDAEKDVFRIIARQNEVRGILSALNNQLNVVLHDEEAFKRELGEAGAVVGREATVYEKATRMQPRNSQEDCRKQIEKIKIRLEDAGGAGGADMVKEYKDTEERDVFLARELMDLEKARKELLTLITELDARIDHEFREGIIRINTEFQKFFALMFGGGKAELSLIKEVRRRKKSGIEGLDMVLRGGESDGAMVGEDEEEQGPEGLEVNVSLPRKKVKGLVMLSGGERALTSIALLFAISQVNPPPFIVLDETDAALDEANSRKYGDMIESLSKQSQLILITHNRETMSRAGVLYGITMGADGASKMLSIDFGEAIKVAK